VQRTYIHPTDPLCGSTLNTLSATVTGHELTLFWEVASADSGWMMHRWSRHQFITFNAGASVSCAIFRLTVTDECGCQAIVHQGSLLPAARNGVLLAHSECLR
jgi:hypothetical protein